MLGPAHFLTSSLRNGWSVREKARIVVGIDQTWAVTDQALSGDLELKYTVDPSGTELLLYRDAVAPHLLKRDRRAVVRSRIIALLPAGARRSIARARQSAPRTRLLARERLHRARARGPRWKGQGLVPVGRMFAPFAATAVDQHDSVTEEHFQRDHILGLFRREGIEAAVLPAGRGTRGTVVIRELDREAACTTLARLLGRTWYVVPLDLPLARPRRVTARRLRRLCALSDGFRVFRYVAAGPDRVLAGAMLGCDVEVWREPRPALLDRPAPIQDYSGKLMSPRRNNWAMQLGPDTWEDAGSRPGHVVDVGALPHVFDVNVPIDVVYTWVDGADDDWLASKRDAIARRGGTPSTDDAKDAARFRSHDELKYSLRSLEVYAPWVRKIHIVTAGQRPEWLNEEHPKIRLVDHRDIFADPSVLPVFNSHAIESQLHRVPGLAEHYLYFNDDVFLGRPVSKDLFFHSNGLSKFFLSTAMVGLGPRKPTEPAFVQAAKNNRELLGEVFGTTVSHHFQHAPHPQLRSSLEHMESKHPEVFAQVAASAFRSPEDLSIASSLHHYYAYNRGHAIPGRLEYLYLDLGHPGAPQRLEQLLRTREFDVFCINDTPDGGTDGVRRARQLEEFLERYYPLPSAFEHGQRPSGMMANTQRMRK